MPTSLFATARDMDRIDRWVTRRLSAPVGGGQSQGLGAAGLKALHDLLARSFTLAPALNAALDADDRRLDALTEEQFHILEFLADRPRARISGGAGTGKTLLALEKAHRMAEQGRRVLLLCYHAPLAGRLRALCANEPEITVRAFSEWVAG